MPSVASRLMCICICSTAATVVSSSASIFFELVAEPGALDSSASVRLPIAHGLRSSLRDSASERTEHRQDPHSSPDGAEGHGALRQIPGMRHVSHFDGVKAAMRALPPVWTFANQNKRESITGKTISVKPTTGTSSAAQPTQESVSETGRSSADAAEPSSAEAAPDPVGGDTTPSAEGIERGQRSSPRRRESFARRNDFSRRPRSTTGDLPRATHSAYPGCRSAQRRGLRADQRQRTCGSLQPTRQRVTGWVGVWSGQPAQWRLPVATRATCRWSRRRSRRCRTRASWACSRARYGPGRPRRNPQHPAVAAAWPKDEHAGVVEAATHNDARNGSRCARSSLERMFSPATRR